MEKEFILDLTGRHPTIWSAIEEAKVCVNTMKKYMKLYNISSPKGFYSKGKPLGRPAGIPMSEEQKSLRSKMFSGKNNPFYKKKHSLSTRLKMSNNHADFSGSNNHLYRKAVSEGRAYQGITGTIWCRITNGAKQRKIPILITPQEIWELYTEQNGKCAFTGRPIPLGTNASLDRKDSSKPYEISNVQWVHKDINYAKFRLNNKEFINLCKEVTEHHAQKSQ